MRVRFIKIPAGRVDPTRVTLRVFDAEDGTILGRVSTLAYGESGIELMSTEGADPPIETALALAVQVASYKEQDIDVVDEQGLWRSDWGQLVLA
jgi:hypothetical protein